MIKIRFIVVVVVIFCTLPCFSQEEFFGNNTGLSVSGTTDFSNIYGGGLSLYLKNGLFFSGSSANVYNINLKSLGIGYIISNRNNENGTNGIFGLSYGFMPNGYKITSVNMGLCQILFPRSNFSSSLGASASISNIFGEYHHEGFNLGVIFGYSQSFFNNNPIYPVMGITYELPINQTNSSKGSFLFHLGINIKLGK